MYNYLYSIVIPHYNSPHLLQRMLDSIPQREDIQVIVVDDCSARQNVELLKQCHHSNLEIVYLPENKGAGYARNIGLKKVQGEWLMVVDADDYFAENAFTMLDKHTNSELDYVCFLVKGLDSKMQDCIVVSDQKVRNHIKYNTDKTLLAFKYLNLVCWNKMVKMDFIRLNDIHFEECMVNNDVLFNLMIGVKAKKVLIIPNELYVTIANDNSITGMKRTIEKEFLFYIQAQKRNGFFYKLGLKHYPFYKSNLLYFLHLLKKRGLTDTIKFFKVVKQNKDVITEAQKAYLFLFDGKLSKNEIISNINK